MQKREIADITYIINECRQDENKNKPKPIVLLGAGASASAYIPMTGDIVKDIIGKYENKPAISRLNDTEKDDYYLLIGALSADERRELFAGYINSPDVKLNVTHIYLAQMLNLGLIDYVFTTNFDDLLIKSAALFNKIPPIYDISNLKDFTTSNFQKNSITYLHGQHYGQWLLNSKGELDKVKGIVSTLFNKVAEKRTWIVVGYSGNDELLDEIAKFGNFDSDLYWIGYKNHDPIDKVKEKLLNQSAKSAFLVSGYDSDSFFLSLHSELKLETPPIFNKPFSFLQSMIKNIKDIEENNSDDEHKEKFKNVKERLENSKAMVKEAIDTIENKAENSLEQEIWEAIVKGDYTKADDFNSKIQNSTPQNIKIRLSVLFNNWAITIDDLAKSKADEELYKQSIEKYKIATTLYPNFDLAFCNWGGTFIELAKLNGNKKFFKESIEKSEMAISINPNLHEAYTNWAVALLHLFIDNHDKNTLKLASEKARMAYELNNKSSYNLACCLELLNNKTEAFKYLEESLKSNEISIKRIEEDKDWHKYQNDAEFKRIVEMYA